jgi:hypothetical protein
MVKNTGIIVAKISLVKAYKIPREENTGEAKI